MTQTIVGLDTAKSVFQVHAVDGAGKVSRRKSRRDELVEFFEKLASCRVVMEACGAAHQWGRLLTNLGHEVRLIAPEAVKPFVKRRRKNDAAGAAAIFEASTRPNIKFVPIETIEQQGVLSSHPAGSLLIKQQTMASNDLRALATEFDLTVPQGIVRLLDLITMIEADVDLSKDARHALKSLFNQCISLADAITKMEASIAEHARKDDTTRRLATIPGIGPITASLLAATIADIGVYPSARHFAA